MTRTATRTLEIGSGTGTNAIWLAERGFDVLGVDVSALAVERARAKMEGRALRCRFATLDVLTASPADGPFEFVFDRGCFHVLMNQARGSGSPRESLPHWRRAGCV